jgi:hypothetical protein
MVRKIVPGTIFCLVGFWVVAVVAAEQPSVELLLPGGTLYSVTHRTYRSLGLPDGWTVAAGAYAPDAQTIAFLLIGHGTQPPPKLKKPRAQVPLGPVNKIAGSWGDSIRLLILDRRTGAVRRTWRLPDDAGESDWQVSWTSADVVNTRSGNRLFEWDVLRHGALKSESVATMPPPAHLSGPCPQTLAEINFHGKGERFIKVAADCSTPPEKLDAYRLVREHEGTHRDAIIWEYHVQADTTTCSASYACYEGQAVQFLSAADRLFLVWDGDLYGFDETEDGVKAELLTQFLPQYTRPWGIAAGETQLDPQDVVSKVGYQPVNAPLAFPNGDNPTLYARNYCPTRSFNAAVDVGDYVKNVMVPAGYRAGPVEIGAFKDRAYTPLLISVTWTAFRHVVNSVFCQQPYTISPNTRGIIVSLTEGAGGTLQCSITAQEDR